jgi:hypothetical protein
MKIAELALSNNHSLTPNTIAFPRIVSSLSVAQGYNDVYPKIISERNEIKCKKCNTARTVPNPPTKS